MSEDAKPKKPSVNDMDEEIKRLELEARKLEVEEKKANLQDLRERLDERELKREVKRQASITNGATLRQLAVNDAAVQSRCNHHKGGDGQNGVIGGQGTDAQYAVLKHMFANGDTWVRCLRCGKTWKPPLRDMYSSDQEYNLAVMQYQTALEFQTRNTGSSAIMYKFSDSGQRYREVLRHTTLR